MRMNAYFYSFTPTGVEGIDKILSAVAQAGKAFHHTNQWSESCEWLGEKSYVDLIQDAANELAAILKQKGVE